MAPHLKRSPGARWLGFILLAAITAASALISAGSMFVGALRQAGQGRDFDPATYERRFEGLKRVLPRGTVVGYLSDRDDPVARAVGSDLRWYLAQDALVPVILTRQDGPGFVVGDFLGASDPAELARRKLFFAGDFGDGLILLRSGAR